MTKIPALLKWIGNKQRFADTITEYMPNHFRNYYEPFLGSGAVMAHLLNKSHEAGRPHFEHVFASDVLPFLIGIFVLVKNEPETLIDYYGKEISSYYDDPISKYDEIRDRFNKNHNALDFCLLSRTCYGGIVRFRQTDGYMSTPRGPHKPISPESFSQRVQIWHLLVDNADFNTMSFEHNFHVI